MSRELYAGPPRAVVAEDDPHMRQLVADALGKQGFVVEQIADGRLLLLRMAARDADRSVDLLVSDVRMPFFSGLDVLKKMRILRYRTPVLLMTAFSEPELREQVNRLDAELIDKPFTRAALATAVLAVRTKGAEAT